MFYIAELSLYQRIGRFIAFAVIPFFFAHNAQSGTCEEYRVNFRITIYECSWFFRIRDVISSACSDTRWPRGTHTRSRIMHARAFRWEKEREAREADGMRRAETRANISLCGSPCSPRAERGLIFLFNSRNEIALVKSTGIFLFATPSPLFLRTNAVADCCATRVEVTRARKSEICVISTPSWIILPFIYEI